ncbi:Cyclin-dependent kinase 1 [Symbiodinium microadriaticum]|uniref:Cyclin-dependent kinase 1 n=1 Tax=Symbiodinium microadriaticum TaxID=2951 RepID=A0A1Q9CB10_SYMMI|nr:Cyclin-dependent kinase 1 [Symbiodinium microadriaticum]
MATGRPLFAGDSEVWPGLTKLPDFKPPVQELELLRGAKLSALASPALVLVGEDGIDLLEKLMYYDPRMASIVICKNMKRDFTNGVIIIFVFIIINHQQPQQ